MKKFAKAADLWRGVLKNLDAANGFDEHLIVEATDASTPRPIGIFFSNMISVPPLNEEDLLHLNSISAPTIVTRHMKREYLDDAVSGYFRFGTTGGYRATEHAVTRGRFSDLSEGRTRKTFNTTSGYHETLTIYGHELSGNYCSPDMDQVVYEERANDFCSCSTIGPFDHERAECFRSKGNPELGAFVSYDLTRLVSALRTVLKRSSVFTDYEFLTRPVEYKVKDLKLQIPERFCLKDASEIDRWLSISFVKPQIFEHEAELRILIFNRNTPGGLDELTQPIVLNDKLIANSIVNQGTF